MSQVQCPNCGGFRIDEEIRSNIAFSNCLMHIILTVVTAGIWPIIWLIIAFFESFQPKPESGLHKYSCQICGYRWNWREGTPLPPVKSDPKLVALGERKLAEEEEARRRQQEQAAFHYLSQQGKK